MLLGSVVHLSWALHRFTSATSLLEALDGVSRLVIAEHGLRRALAERQGDDVTAVGAPPRLPEYVRADLSSSGA